MLLPDASELVAASLTVPAVACSSVLLVLTRLALTSEEVTTCAAVLAGATTENKSSTFGAS